MQKTEKTENRIAGKFVFRDTDEVKDNSIHDEDEVEDRRENTEITESTHSERRSRREVKYLF